MTRPAVILWTVIGLAAASAALCPGPVAGATPGAAWAMAQNSLTASLAVTHSSAPDTFTFTPVAPGPEDEAEATTGHRARRNQDHWISAPFGERLLTDPEQWRADSDRVSSLDPTADYNRVDRLRTGLHFQHQPRGHFAPRLGARLEYALGRERTLYGVQFEQSLARDGAFAIGASMVRVTDHNELQQMDDLENSLALLFGRQDYRDYFERQGFGAYALARVPGVSTMSVHARRDEYRSLPLDLGTRSFFHRGRRLRDNPPIDEGRGHTLALRLERLARPSSPARAGLYHWIDVERAGGALGGDFDYLRLLADLRSVLRLSPATTLALRLVGGHTASGELPAQKEFTLGGVDGLRAHTFAQFRGNQLALAQAEYTVGLWPISSDWFEGGLHAIAFVDAGRAWRDTGRSWNAVRQQFEVDGGLGISTSEDNVRLYLARDLQTPGADFVLSLRLQRPF